MKNENKTGVLEAMSLIHPEYVEAAVYQETGAGKTLNSGKKWWKTAVAAAAVIAVSVTCVRFAPQIKAFAEEWLNGSTIFSDGQTFDGKMGLVHIRDDFRNWEERYETKYQSIEEVEELAGIHLLHSSRTYDTPVPMVSIGGADWLSVLSVEDPYYYMYHQYVDLEQDAEGHNCKITENDAYCISYYAVLLTDRPGEGNEGMNSQYEDANLVEVYTTDNGLTAGIFDFGGSYHAVIYHDNIRYELEMDAYRGYGKLHVFKEFLDTLC